MDRDVPDTHKGTDTSGDLTESISTCRNTTQTRSLPVGAGRHDEAKSRSRVGMLNMRVDTHGVAYHVNTTGDTQEHVSTHPENPKPPDSPTESATRHTGETDRLEAHVGMQRARTHVHHVGNSSKRPTKMSIMPDLPARGAEPHKGDLERLQSQSHVLNMRARTQSVVSNSNTPGNVSVTSETPGLPARGTILRTGEPKRLESRSDASDAWTRMQQVANDSRRPTNRSERVRKAQNDCKKSNLPG